MSGFLLMLFACNNPEMKLTILHKTAIANLPSGSGLVKSGNTYYAIGDDSPFFFTLDSTFSVVSATPFPGIGAYTGVRIPKPVKPDLEAMDLAGENEIAVFGSGSRSPQRDVFYRILLQDTPRIERYDLTPLYNYLKSLDAFADSELNIEAAACYGGDIYLFNRNKNMVIWFGYADLLAGLQQRIPFPEPGISECALPEFHGVKAGFSGATALHQQSKIIFTASLELTDNAYDDGAILGSIIGVMDIADNGAPASITYCRIDDAGVELKAESVIIDEEIAVGKTGVILITDDDKGNSTAIKGILEW